MPTSHPASHSAISVQQYCATAANAKALLPSRIMFWPCSAQGMQPIASKCITGFRNACCDASSGVLSVC
jgi:hypothetical protein